eukprot:scaffold62938_cov46-Phaeocystis_antarctica.AAC.2
MRLHRHRRTCLLLRLRSQFCCRPPPPRVCRRGRARLRHRPHRCRLFLPPARRFCPARQVEGG